MPGSSQQVIPQIEAEQLSVFYGDVQAIKSVSISIPRRKITALIGPSGCGKSTFLRTLNRMNDMVDGVSVAGRVLIDGEDIYGPGVDVVALRKKIGMVFQRPNPFPMSIIDNVTWALKTHGKFSRKELKEIGEESLQRVGLWNEVQGRLDDPAMGLSGGQQQRLCIARAIALQPEILLMDEPTSALDPVSARIIEDLMESLKEDYTVILVSHNMEQAARVSDYTAFFWLGELVEYGPTERIFFKPANSRTEDYVTGRFG